MAMRITRIFREFMASKKSEGFVLIACTLISILIANSGAGTSFLHLLHSHVDLSFAGLDLNFSVEHWINDFLMAIFFLMVGLEIERELYVGELSSFKNALLPILAAVGGMVIPAGIHYLFNAGTPFQAGFGIPMATDIAFALGILSLAGKRVPVALKVFLTALAIIDDLGAITVIALFYTKELLLSYLLSSLGVFLLLFIAGKKKVHFMPLYLVGGLVMWYCMMKSGVHASIAGVLLAFAIPFPKGDADNPSYNLQHKLHLPVAFIILPLFALANTAIVLPADIAAGLSTSNSMGIMLGLLAGKPIGILLFSWLSIKAGWTSLPTGVTMRFIFGASILAGIGFTMSIFITNLAFTDNGTITGSKLSILVASGVAAVLGLVALRSATRLGEAKGTKPDQAD